MEINNTTAKGAFLVIQNSRVVGIATSLDEARVIRDHEIQRDQLHLLLKKRLLKKLLKSGKDLVTDQYMICEVVEK